MKAMILAAGEGRRMRPLTLATPKPLLLIGQQSLLEHQIRKLAAAGIREILINVSYLAEQVVTSLKRMDLTDITCEVSVEETPLETGGAILNALPFFEGEPFLLVNSDVWTDFDFRSLLEKKMPEAKMAHLILVANPEHNPEGDFCIGASSSVHVAASSDSQSTYTFSGISVIRPALIEAYPKRRAVFPLGETLRHAMQRELVSGEVYTGQWVDVGTIERLEYVRGLSALTG